MKQANTAITSLPDRGIDLGLGSRMQVRYDITPDEFSNCVAELKANAAYTLLQENTIGENVYLTFSKGEELHHLSYTATSRTVRLVTDTMARVTVPPLAPTPFVKTTDSTLCVLSLDYTHREITDGNGMSYAVILADGSYLIIDGGYRRDAARLYRFLADHNQRTDGKIVIAAWLMTHSHGDHNGAFREFAAQYADKVTLQRFIMDPTKAELLHRGKGYSPYLPELVFEDLTHFGKVDIVRPHTGQRLYFCDTVLEIYYTAQDHLPRALPYLNDASIAFKLHIGEQTVLFMADCEKTTSELICDMHGTALKSDVVQVNHHGYSGGTVELYELISPAWSLWTTNQISFDLRVVGEKYKFIGNATESNKYLFDTLGRSRCIVADGACKLLHFPLNNENDIAYYDYPETI